MPTKKTQWKVTDTRFVAFIDILGFKDKVMRDTHHHIYSQLSKISKTKRSIEKLADNEEFMKQFGDSDVYIVNFSDSIVVFSKNDSFDNFIYFLTVVNYLFTDAIRNIIPLKGGMAHGIISVNKADQIYFGQPIIDAYLIEEEVKYLGIIAHNSIDKYVNQNWHKINHDLFTKYLFETKTPLKSGIIEHLNINWFSMVSSSNVLIDQIEMVYTVLREFKNSVSGSSRIYIDNTFDVFDNNKNDLMYIYKKHDKNL